VLEGPCHAAWCRQPAMCVYGPPVVKPFLLQSPVAQALPASQELLGLPLDKRMRLTNWARRPLTKPQVEYAALDAHCLLLMHKEMASRAPAEVTRGRNRRGGAGRGGRSAGTG
jgi:hypothetical protein